jgi:acyl-CoA dehydrogenase
MFASSLDPGLLIACFCSFQHQRAKDAYMRLVDFVENDCIPAEKVYQAQMGIGEKRFEVVPPVIDELKTKARSLGLWNMFMTADYSKEVGA